MDMAQSGYQRGSNFPVDNATYNLLQALVSKLEAIEAYGKYQNDEDGGELFGQLMGQEQQQAQQLLTELRQRLGAGSGTAVREKSLVG
jgi:hypothetical protein